MSNPEAPSAYLHVMHMELGQTRREVTLSDKAPWGRRGVDYDPSYSVISIPLYAHASPSKRARQTAHLNWASASLLSLARSNVPPDVQELLVNGDPGQNVAPGALVAAVMAAFEAERQATRPMAEKPNGVVQISVRSLEADGRWRDEGMLISGREWVSAILTPPSVIALIGRAVAAALEAERVATYGAGPRGNLP